MSYSSSHQVHLNWLTIQLIWLNSKYWCRRRDAGVAPVLQVLTLELVINISRINHINISLQHQRPSSPLQGLVIWTSSDSYFHHQCHVIVVAVFQMSICYHGDVFNERCYKYKCFTNHLRNIRLYHRHQLLCEQVQD